MSERSQIPLVICVTGAECAGKTTLAGALSRILDVQLVPEMAREYLAGKTGYDRQDVLAIAREQEAVERAAMKDAPLVVADTDLTVIQVWWEEKYGRLDPWIAAALRRRTDRRYLLTRPDLPWEPDPLRESPHDRDRLHQRYLQILDESGFAFAEVWGRGDERMERALRQVRAWLAEKKDQSSVVSY